MINKKMPNLPSFHNQPTIIAKSIPSETNSLYLNSSSMSNNPDLLLHEFNESRRNKTHNINLSGYSPYYKGLTDYSLAIKKPSHSDSTTTISIISSGIKSILFRRKRTPIEILNRPSSSLTKRKPLRESEALDQLQLTKLKTTTVNKTQTNTIKLMTATIPIHRALQVRDDEMEIVNRRVFEWADKYRPEALKDFICNRNTALQLQAMVKREHCGHFIFQGPPGVGKRTMICALLNEAFGPDIVQGQEKSKLFLLKGEDIKSIKATLKMSKKHVEINLAQLKGYEKHVIVELIKDTNTKLTSTPTKCTKKECQAVVLYGADRLSVDTLSYIKWQLEKYRGCNNVLFCCTDVSNFQPILSLCTIIQLSKPSNEEIVQVLICIARQEEIELSREMAERIADNSNSNLRQAIRSFEATWHSNPQLKEDQEIIMGWEEDIGYIAKNMIQEQSSRQLYIIRGKLQNLIDHSVSPEFIFTTLLQELKKHLGQHLQTEIKNIYRDYKNRLEETNRRHVNPSRSNFQQFMRIEEFIAKFMSWYKVSLINKT